MIQKLLPFFALIAALALFLGYIKPAFSGPITELKAQNQVDDQALDAAKRFQTREAELTKERDAIPAENLARIEAYIPQNVDTVHIVIDLNAIASRTGVALGNFTVVGNGASTPTLSSSSVTDPIDLSLTVTGTYSAFRAFLSGLESSLRPYDITNIAVTSSATGVYTYTLTVRTYSLH